MCVFQTLNYDLFSVGVVVVVYFETLINKNNGLIGLGGQRQQQGPGGKD